MFERYLLLSHMPVRLLRGLVLPLDWTVSLLVRVSDVKHGYCRGVATARASVGAARVSVPVERASVRPARGTVRPAPYGNERGTKFLSARNSQVVAGAVVAGALAWSSDGVERESVGAARVTIGAARVSERTVDWTVCGCEVL